MKAKQFYLIILCLCLGTLASFAQGEDLSVKGRIVDEAGAKLVGAHVQFSSMGTTPKVTDVVSDSAGGFEVKLPLNYYTMRVTYTGFAPYEAQVECLGNMNLPPIVLRENSSELAGVEITAKRISYNTKGYVASLANDPLLKNSSLADALRMLPGINLEEGSFSAFGEKIGSAFVNNKRLMFKGEALTRYLSHLQAKNIVSVEVLNSSADPLLTDKMAFVLKITTNRADDGGSASVGPSATLSNVYEFEVNPSVHVEQRVGKWSMFLTPDYSPRSMLNRGSKGLTHYYESDVVRRETTMMHMKVKPSVGVTAGLAYDFDKNNNLSLNLSATHQDKTLSNSTHNEIQEDGQLTSVTDGYVADYSKSNYFQGMLNYFGTLPVVTLFGSLDYAFKGSDGNIQRNQTVGESQQSLFRQDKKSYYHLLSASVSATWKLSKAHRVVTSVSVDDWDNNNDYSQLAAQGSDRYRYLYNETSFRGSLGYEFRQGAWDLSIGSRYLKSHMKPLLEQGGEVASYKRNVNKWLPYATLTYVYNQKRYETITLQYERSYNFSNLIAMDPSVQWKSEYSYEKGNPHLNPGFTDEVALQMRVRQFSFRAKFMNTLEPGRTYELDEQGNEVISAANGLHSQRLFFYVSFPLLQITRKWNVSYYLTYDWLRSRYGQNKQVSSQVTGGFTSMATLPGGFSLQCSAMLCSPQRSVYSTQYYLGNADASVGKWMMNNHLYVGAGARYMFSSRSSTKTALFRYDSRLDRPLFTASLSVRYRLAWGNKRARVNSNKVISTESMRMN